MSTDHRAFGYCLLRTTVGAVFLFYSIDKFLAGNTRFAQGLRKDFATTWLPASIVYGIGLVLPFAELLTGSLLLLGLFTQSALACGGILLVLLTAG